MKKTSMAEDYKKQIDWIMKAYETAKVSFEDGFQKDAIQNAVGARKKESWSNWKCSINTLENSYGRFLIVEDEGTAGLTGPNLSKEEIESIIDELDEQETIDPEWRLARFSSRNVSGGTQYGPGTYGVGKTVYCAASKDYDYIFDSLRDDGKYVANRNEGGQIFERAFEDDEAKEFVMETTGLEQKKTIGTRIIIFNPRDELCESVNNGDIVKFIQESWWRCIEKMPDDSGIFINGVRVGLPVFEKHEHEFEMDKTEVYESGYRVKKFGFFIEPKGKECEWNGISYYRKGMKIGRVDLNDIPAEIKDRYWGYIEVDNEWEERLAKIEDAVHYGVIPQKKLTNTYQNMKLFMAKKIEGLLVEWGYKKDREYEDKILQETLKEISSELHELFDDMGFEDLGKGGKKPDFCIRWKDVVYPHEDTLTVLHGDSISFGFRLSNEYITDKTFLYQLDVISMNGHKVMGKLESGSVKLKPGDTCDKHFEYVIAGSNAEEYEENRIVLTVSVAGSTKEKRKELPFFFNVEKEDNSRGEVILALHSAEYPNENSRRINFDEALKNMSYLVENKRNFSLDFRISISLHNCTDSKVSPKIMDVGQYFGTVKPYEEIVVTGIPDIVFEKEKIEPYMTKGIIEVRAHLVAMNDSDEYEKGDRITHFYQRVFLNMNEKRGKEGSFEPKTVDDPDNFRRSWCQGGTRIIYVNSGHPAYKMTRLDPDQWRSYLKQEMLKQYVLLYLEEGQYSIFGDGADIRTMNAVDAGKCIMDKIEQVYQQSFN